MLCHVFAMYNYYINIRVNSPKLLLRAEAEGRGHARLRTVQGKEEYKKVHHIQAFWTHKLSGGYEGMSSATCRRVARMLIRYDCVAVTGLWPDVMWREKKNCWSRQRQMAKPGLELLEKRNRVRFDLLSPTPHPSTRVLYASPLASSSLELTREVFVTWPEGDEVGMGWRGLLRAGGIDWQRRLASWLAPTVFVMCVHVCACVCVHVRRWSGTWHVQNVSEVWRQWSVRRTLESTLQKVPICSEDWDSH